jgi:excisionase family DNA binding protein
MHLNFKKMQDFVLVSVEKLLAQIRSMLSTEFAQQKDQQPQSKTEKLMTIEDVVKMFKVTKVTIHKWKKKKLIPFYRMGRKIYFKEQELLELVTSKKKNNIVR